jgi:hypothetical protein
VTIDEVVRPLELDAGQAFAFQCVHDRDSDRERQAGHESGALLVAPAQREREAAPGDGGPRATAATASSRLPFGGKQRAVDIAARGAPKELARRRVDLVDDLDCDRRLRRDARQRGNGERDVVVVGGRQQCRARIG